MGALDDDYDDDDGEDGGSVCIVVVKHVHSSRLCKTYLNVHSDQIIITST